ncbi:MAG: nucleotidyltransferase family protein [Parcubacteria group bacterium]|nr:nucleotidyltransferase family protein [Parcubacteria group bacterium]
MTNLNLEKIKNILVENGIKSAAIFGSRARGEEKPNSDLDILIKFREDKIKGLFEFIALERKLSETLGLKVDLVTEDSISPYIRESVLRDLKIIYQ